MGVSFVGCYAPAETEGISNCPSKQACWGNDQPCHPTFDILFTLSFSLSIFTLYFCASSCSATVQACTANTEHGVCGLTYLRLRTHGRAQAERLQRQPQPRLQRRPCGRRRRARQHRRRVARRHGLLRPHVKRFRSLALEPSDRMPGEGDIDLGW